MEFTLLFNNSNLTSPDKYVVDQYGNRYMVFSDAAGNKFKIRRDDIIIDMGTGKCTSRHKTLNALRL